MRLVRRVEFFFWKWPKEHYISVSYGRKNFVREGLPINYVPLSAVGSEFKERMREKLSSVSMKGYVVIKDEVKYLNHFFLVTKT